VFRGHATPRELIGQHLGLPDRGRHFFSVTRPVIPPRCSKPGDVDWLCVDPEQPHPAMAAECKRVKVVALRDGSDHVNKIVSLGDGTKANSLASLGFHRTFLVVLIVVDERARTEHNVVSRGMAETTFHRIYDFPQRDSLNAEVGVVYIEVVQPSLRSVNIMAQIGVCVDQQAKPREQATELTNLIRDLLRRLG
jgi:hypothetical protein